MFVKYANRKIYCKETSRYVTLADLGKRVKNNQPVIVIDNKTKNDITAETLAQYIGFNARNLTQVTEFIRGME